MFTSLVGCGTSFLDTDEYLDLADLHTSWNEVDGGPWLKSINGTVGADMAVDPEEYPVVAWEELNILSGTSSISVQKWNGEERQRLGPTLRFQGGIRRPGVKLTLLEDATPVLTWSDGALKVVRLVEGQWEKLLETAGAIPIGLYHHQSRINVGYALQGELWVTTYSRGEQRWMTLPRVPLMGKLAVRHYAAMAPDPSGYPVVATVTQTPGLEVWRWDGSIWVSLGNVLEGDPHRDGEIVSLDLSMDSRNRAVVVYGFASDQGSFDLTVKRQRSSGWQQLGNTIAGAKDPSLITLPSTNPVMAFVDTPKPLKNGAVEVWRWSGQVWKLISDLPIQNGEHTRPLLRLPQYEKTPLYLAYLDRNDSSRDTNTEWLYLRSR